MRVSCSPMNGRKKSECLATHHAEHRIRISVRESDRDRSSGSDISHQRWPETGNTGSATMANAGINNSGRSRLQQFDRQFLRCFITVGIETHVIPLAGSEIVKLGPKVGHEVAIRSNLLFLPVNLP